LDTEPDASEASQAKPYHDGPKTLVPFKLNADAALHHIQNGQNRLVVLPVQKRAIKQLAQSRDNPIMVASLSAVKEGNHRYLATVRKYSCVPIRRSKLLISREPQKRVYADVRLQCSDMEDDGSRCAFL
jgi:hypothetical protein